LVMASEKGHNNVVELLLSSGSTYEDSRLPSTSTNGNVTEQQEPILEEIDGGQIDGGQIDGGESGGGEIDGGESGGGEIDGGETDGGGVDG
jgi:hypothetical protein